MTTPTPFDEQGTPSPSESFGFRPATPFDVLVEEFYKKYYNDEFCYFDGEFTPKFVGDWLRAALTTHGAKERERLVREIEAATTHILPLPDDAARLIELGLDLVPALLLGLLAVVVGSA